MKRKSLTVGTAWMLGILLLHSASVPMFAGTRVSQSEQESKEEKKLREQQDKQSKKEEERKEKEAKARSKEEKKYNTLLEFAQDHYASDIEFRDHVDRAYKDLESQHALQAYQINTTRTTELVSPETEDQTLKIRRVLYDNPWVQDYVNRVGQRLVPDDSNKLYAFRVTYHPIPYAYTLSTGTVLISTGMISLLDNEAQLAYVLGHELAHVYKEHWRVKVMMPLAEEEYNKRQEKKRALWGALFAMGGAGIGGAAKGSTGAIIGALSGLVAGEVVGALFNRKIGLDWEDVQENEADDFALKAVLDRAYDPQEVPKLFASMDEVSRLDERVQLGFLGLRGRLKARREFAERALAGPLQAKYNDLMKSGKMLGSTSDFNLLTAELKRDNGIEAYKFDMFEMARRNLKQAVELRSDDARAAFYYGRVLKLVGRTKEESDTAQQYLLRAISLDTRKTIPEVQLQRALLLMDNKDGSRTEAGQAIKDYIVAFQNHKIEQRRQDGSLPPNLDTLYDYLRLMGDPSWKPPAPELVPVSIPNHRGEPGDPPPPGPQNERPRSTRKGS